VGSSIYSSTTHGSQYW